MAARITCIPCSMGECEDHIEGQTRPGVLGGWLCPCNHFEIERAAAKHRWQAHVRSILRPNVDRT